MSDEEDWPWWQILCLSVAVVALLPALFGVLALATWLTR